MMVDKQQYKICIIGGTGFVGRHLTNRLCSSGHEITVISRREQHNQNIGIHPNLKLIIGDVFNKGFLTSALRDHDVVINLVGILNEKGRDGGGFEKAHVELPRTIVEACKNAGINRYLHMSALNADSEGPSFYLQSKGRAEELIAAAATEQLHTTLIRPSVIFGPGDSFVNRFAGLLRVTPLIFPLACANARFQPVYVGDVVSAFATLVDNPAKHVQAYDLCGPEQYSLNEIVDYIVQCLGLNRKIIPLGDFLSKLQGKIMDFVPGKPFSTDNYLSTKIDSVCNVDGNCGLEDLLGVQAIGMKQIVPLMFSSSSDNYDRYRRNSGR